MHINASNFYDYVPVPYKRPTRVFFSTGGPGSARAQTDSVIFNGLKASVIFNGLKATKRPSLEDPSSSDIDPEGSAQELINTIFYNGEIPSPSNEGSALPAAPPRKRVNAVAAV
jgi:hypothetical protein